MSQDFRCKGCCRLLFKGRIQSVEIKCPRCGCLQKIGGCCRNTSSPSGQGDKNA